jgi:hypothetical protein
MRDSTHSFGMETVVWSAAPYALIKGNQIAAQIYRHYVTFHQGFFRIFFPDMCRDLYPFFLTLVSV